MKDELTITKLEAARRQLETAVRLYFDEGDPVSIHTLASAALQLIRKLNQSTGGKPLFREAEFLDLFKHEARKGVIDKLNEAANFFKHADRDPTGSIAFKLVQPEIVMMEACQWFAVVNGQTSAIFNVFLAWYDLRHPGVFVHPPEEDASRSQWRDTAQHLSKREFLQEMLPVAEKKYPPLRREAR